jgi:hypothetical protein
MLNETNLRLHPHDNQENWQMDESENCTFLPKKGDANKEPYLVNIWKTMPYIARGLPKDHIVVKLNDKIYCNDPECFPSVSPFIFEQNYRSLYRQKNRHFEHRWLKHGDTLELATWNEDDDLVFVTTKKDPSYCDVCSSEHPIYNVQINFEPAYLQIWHPPF